MAKGFIHSIHVLGGTAKIPPASVVPSLITLPPCSHHVQLLLLGAHRDWTIWKWRPATPIFARAAVLGRTALKRQSFVSISVALFGATANYRHLLKSLGLDPRLSPDLHTELLCTRYKRPTIWTFP